MPRLLASTSPVTIALLAAFWIAPGLAAAQDAGNATRATRSEDAGLLALGPARAHGRFGGPVVRVGEPPSAMTSDAPPPPHRVVTGEVDLDWLQGLELPDIPVRLDERVLDYLRYFREDPNGRVSMKTWLRRSQRYGDMVRSVLQKHDLPQDLMYVAMVESGFDPTASSNAGAVGMWQFVGITAQEYGLERTRWLDERMSLERSTDAAARYLSDMHERLGSWELALAAYNMGYGGMLRTVRKYNTNDFWLLAELEAGLPFETVSYVAKVMACAIVGRNPDHFGFADLKRDAPLDVEPVELPGGTYLKHVARAAGVEYETIADLNPELRRRRVPPSMRTYPVRIPSDSAERFGRVWSRRHPQRPAHDTYVVRFGESLEDIAYRYHTSERALRRLNGLAEDEHVRAGFEVLVPAVEPREPREPEEEEVATVPRRNFAYRDRERVFYKVAAHDTLQKVARFFQVTRDELRSWNNLDPEAHLQAGMLLQLFVPDEARLSRAVVLTPDEVRVLVVGSREFFDYHEAQRDRVRIRYRVQPGDSLRRLSKRFELSVGSIARINQFSRYSELVPGQEIIIYVPKQAVRRLSDEELASNERDRSAERH